MSKSIIGWGIMGLIAGIVISFYAYPDKVLKLGNINDGLIRGINWSNFIGLVLIWVIVFVLIGFFRERKKSKKK